MTDFAAYATERGDGRISQMSLGSFHTISYVFHGSPKSGFRFLRPHRSNDIGSVTSNKLHAVYATPDICCAIAFSLVRGLTGRFVVERTNGITKSMFPSGFYSQIVENTGYVYVLDRSHFSNFKGFQCSTFEIVPVIDFFAVTLTDYSYFGGEIEFSIPD